MIQVPLFDAVLTGGLSWDRLQHWGEAGMGFLKEKAQALWGNRRGVSLLFFQAGASGFQDKLGPG